MNGIWLVDKAGFGNAVFLNRDPREVARKKKQFESSLPFPVEWEWNGMREETGNELRHYIMNQSEAHNRSYPESKIIVVLVVSNLCSLFVCASV